MTQPEDLDYPEDLQPVLTTFGEEIDALMSALESGLLPPSVWRERFAALLAAHILGAYFAGTGAIAMSEPARDWVGEWLGRQLDYLNGFAAAVAASTAFVPAWKARGRMYAASVVAPYWFGHTEELPLPAYPGDLSSQCGQNCNCEIFIEWDDRARGDARAYWRLNRRRVSIDNCQTCKERADKWNPLVIRNWSLVIPRER